MNERKPKQKIVTHGGVEYTLQHPGVRKALQIMDVSKGPNGILSEPLYGQLMEHVIVSPRTNWDYWDQHVESMEGVMTEAFRFLVAPGSSD